jgi:hypothetical protein
VYVLFSIRKDTSRKYFDATIGRATCEARSSTRSLCINSAFAVGPKETMENLHRIGRSRDLAFAKRILTRSSELKTCNLTLNVQSQSHITTDN